LEDNSWILL